MELFRAVEERRSIRKFKSDEVPDALIRELLDAARLAPSGSNLQATRFVVIKSPQERMKLKECTPLPFVAHAPVVIACCIDKEAMGNTLVRYRELMEAQAFVGTPLADDPTRALALLATFYWPLATTSFLGLGIQPLVTFFIGHGRAPLESLAVLPVVNALLFLPRSLAFALQEVGIALIGERQEGYPALRRFAAGLNVALGVAFLIVVWTPLAGSWFGTVSGLPAELARIALLLSSCSRIEWLYLHRVLEEGVKVSA